MESIAEVERVFREESLRGIEDYLRGFAHGMKCFRQAGEKAAATTGELSPVVETTAYPIYMALVLNLEKIESLRSTPELHKWLKAELGENAVGDLKRIEKICERIGIKFPRGRPRKK